MTAYNPKKTVPDHIESTATGDVVYVGYVQMTNRNITLSFIVEFTGPPGTRVPGVISDINMRLTADGKRLEQETLEQKEDGPEAAPEEEEVEDEEDNHSKKKRKRRCAE